MCAHWIECSLFFTFYCSWSWENFLVGVPFFSQVTPFRQTFLDFSCSEIGLLCLYTSICMMCQDVQLSKSYTKRWCVNSRTCLMAGLLISRYWYCYQQYRRYTSYAVWKWVLAIVFHLFWKHSIPILLSSGAVVNSVNNKTTVSERVKTRT